MPISLIVGPPNSGRAPAIRARLEAGLDREPVLVVPTGDDAAQFERELCDSGGAMVGAAIRTFGSLFDRAAQATGVRLRPLLSEPQRLALVRAAVAATPLRLLHRSAARPGFAPALDALIAELQGALVDPAELRAAADELERGGYERELADLYAAYVGLREEAGRGDAGSRAAATVAALAVRPDAWEGWPVLVYGFDDLSRVQLELLAQIGRSAEVTVAVNYGDREALAVLAPLLSRLRHDLGAEVAATLEHDPSHTGRRSLRHLDRHLFEPGAEGVDPDGGVVLLECAGELGEAEAIAAEIAGLLDRGVPPAEIVVVARDVAGRGPAIGRALARFDIPAAVETSVGLSQTAVGRSLIALCRAATPQGGPADLLGHLRADPAMSQDAADWLERRIRRDRPRSVEEAIASWERPPRHLAAVREAAGASGRMRALAEVARRLAEDPHRERAPVGAADGGTAPFEPLELRAAAVAAELLEELAGVGRLPGCAAPDLAEAAEAIEAARVPFWRGPAEGRVRVLDPYRVRAARARYLFCCGLVEGEFPRRWGQDPLLSDERRSALGIPALLRREPHEEERYLFHACVSRPTERLYLSWQACDDEGAPSARSPFVDEVIDLVAGPEGEAEGLVRRRGLERVAFEPEEAPSERELARSLALRGAAAGGSEALDALEVPDPVRQRVGAALAELPPGGPGSLPGPLRAGPVLEELGARETLSASSLESWLECSYRWFVQHELRPQRLDPDPDPLRLGTVAHAALQRLYADPPGADAIPRPGDVGAWKARLAELIDEAAAEQGMRPEDPADAVSLARLRAQLERFIGEEAALDTEMRPRRDLLETRFGFGEDGPGPLDLGGAKLRGAIDRIDVAPDGASAIVRDYKTGAKAPGRGSWEREGRLQLQLYVLAARELLGLDPIGGLYQPLGARDDRRPRGMTIKGDPRLGDLALVRGDPCDPDELEAELDRARAVAAEKAAAMRAGAIDRDPLGGTCPSYCAYQPICRLERALGLEEAPGGGEGNGGS